MMSAARRCDPPPRSGGRHLRAKVTLPDGRQEGTRLLETPLHPLPLWWANGEAWQDTDLVEVDLCSASVYTFPGTKVLHGQGWREHVLYLKAGCHPCLVISDVLEESK